MVHFVGMREAVSDVLNSAKAFIEVCQTEQVAVPGSYLDKLLKASQSITDDFLKLIHNPNATKAQLKAMQERGFVLLPRNTARNVLFAFMRFPFPYVLRVQTKARCIDAGRYHALIERRRGARR
jgi:hypothetical protein